MRPTLSTRKPVDKLTIEDFDTFPIWVYALEEEGVGDQDETWVRPFPDGDCSNQLQWHVSAEFLAPDGTSYQGFVEVHKEGKAFLAYWGILLNEGAYLHVEKSSLPAALKKSESALFPMQYKLKTDVPKWKSLRSGVLPVR